MVGWAYGCDKECIQNFGGEIYRDREEGERMMFRAVFWVILPCEMIVSHGSITQKTALNIILAAVRT
jgi:hypothetical protein